jgi:polygalacturonase
MFIVLSGGSVVSADAAGVIRVEDFGAAADGKTDCTVAFQKAIAQANEQGPGMTIQLGKGRYILSTKLPDTLVESPSASKLQGKDKEEFELFKRSRKVYIAPCIMMADVKGVTLAGAGAETEIIITCPMAAAFQVSNCADIVFKDLAIDYDPLPFTQGTITAVDTGAGTFDYRIDEGFPSLGEYWFNKCDARWGMAFDENRRFRMGADSVAFSDNWDDLGDRSWRMHLHYPAQAKNLKVGDRFVHIARMGGSSALSFSQCSNVKIDNVHIYACGGAATVFSRCEGDIHIDGLRIRPRPGSGRIFSTNADGVHCQSCRKGPLIENCVFEGMADDGMNFYTPPSIITEILAPDKVRVNSIRALRKGDRMQIVRPLDGTIRAADAEAALVEGDVVTFAQGIEGLQAGVNHTEADTIFNLSACGSGFIVRNNILGGFRGRGVLARAHHGLIENNLIRQTSGQGIVICNEPDWPEGPIPADVTIRNNTLVGVLRDAGQQNLGAIEVSACKLGQQVADKPAVRNVLIENNRIVDSPGRAIVLRGVSDAVIRGNMVQLTANDRPVKEYSGITLKNCEGVKIEDFTMLDQWSRIIAAVSLEGTAREQVSIADVHADLAAQGQLVKQQ